MYIDYENSKENVEKMIKTLLKHIIIDYGIKHSFNIAINNFTIPDNDDWKLHLTKTPTGYNIFMYNQRLNRSISFMSPYSMVEFMIQHGKDLILSLEEF